MLLYTSVKAQNVSPTATQQFLDTNDISASINSNGILFKNGSLPGFEVPKGSGKHTIYMNNIWIAGLDGSSQLHTTAQTYLQSFGPDFFYGPIATDYNEANYLAKYNSVWKVNKSTIDYHITHYNSGGYVVPASIANWPGSGNVANGEASHLAPYYDANSNNIYDPANGDYPIIRGDQAVFFMINDDKTAHGNGGLKFGIEVHGMAYSFANPNDSALKQTVFVNYEIFNRSVVNYHNVYMGSWSDMDLGNANDDYVGCDSLLNLLYTYNGYGNDGSGLPGQYGTNPPAQGAVWLNHSSQNVCIFVGLLGILILMHP